MVISLGNPFLSYYINNYILKKSKEFSIPKPLSIHIDKTSRLYTVDHNDYLDYHLSYINH